MTMLVLTRGLLHDGILDKLYISETFILYFSECPAVQDQSEPYKSHEFCSERY